MNHHAHTENSVTIFGGKASDYEEIHRIVDLNKIVSGFTCSRFFMHHIDIGGAILEAIFGKTITNSDSKEIATMDIMRQHLIEDYDDLPKFEDWVKSFNSTQMESLISMRESIMDTASEDQFRIRAYKEKLLSKLAREDVDRLISILNLSAFTKNENILNSFGKYMVFGHATGMYLAEMVMGPYVGKSKIATVDAFRDLLWFKFGNVFNILNFEMYIDKKGWMLVPDKTERKNTETTVKKMGPDHVFTRIASEKEGDYARRIGEFNEEQKTN